MKYIVIFLVLVNAAYFAWLHFGAEPVRLQTHTESRPLLSDGLILVSEYKAQLEEQDEQDQESELICLSVTGFSDIDDANSFVAEAHGLGLVAARQLLDIQLPSQYRLFLPPGSSRAVSTLTLNRLNELAEDAEVSVESYLITRGPLENAIALGVFESLDDAEEVQAVVAGLGYAPEIQEIPRSDTGITIQLGATGSLPLLSSEWTTLSEQRSYLDATENLCETIAQGDQFP